GWVLTRRRPATLAYLRGPFRAPSRRAARSELRSLPFSPSALPQRQAHTVRHKQAGARARHPVERLRPRGFAVRSRVQAVQPLAREKYQKPLGTGPRSEPVKLGA